MRFKKKVVASYRSSFVVITKVVQRRNTFTLKQKQQEEKKSIYNLPQICGLNIKQYLKPLHCLAEILPCLLLWEFCHDLSSYVLFFVLQTQSFCSIFWWLGTTYHCTSHMGLHCVQGSKKKKKQHFYSAESFCEQPT